MLKWFRDWRRGYSDADISSMREKMSRPSYPGGLVEVTLRELRALMREGRE